MVDEKLSALDPEPVLEAEDLMYVVVEPDGTPVSKRVTLSTLVAFLDGTFGTDAVIAALGSTYASHHHVPPIGVYVPLPQSDPGTLVMAVDALYFCGILGLDVARTLSTVSFTVTSGGDGSAVFRVGYTRVSAAGVTQGETLTELGNGVATGIATVDIGSLAAVLTPGNYAFYALTNGETATPPTVRSGLPTAGGLPFKAASAAGAVLLRGLSSPASYGAGMPATVPAMTSAPVTVPSLGLQFSA